MPQQNGRVERKYATLLGRVRAMLNSAGLSGKYENLRHGLWAECVNTTTKLANIAAPSRKQLPHFQFFQTTPSFVSNLRVFGEIGVVNDAAPLQSKLTNQGEHCMFIGYADDHASGTFRMFNLKTHRIWMTRDIRWVAANIIKYDDMRNNPLTKRNDDDDDEDEIVKTRTTAQTTNNDDDQDDDEDNNNEDDGEDADEDNNDEDKDEDDDNEDDDDDDDNGKDDTNNNANNKDEDNSPKVLSRTIHVMRKLATSYNPYATDYVE